MRAVALKMDTPFVNVFAIIMVIHMKDVDQNVLEIRIVQWAKHVFETNAKIHALECAALKPSAVYQITFRYVRARQEQLAMHSDNVLSLLNAKDQ